MLYITTQQLYPAKVFQNGMSQAIRLPKALRVDTKEVYIRKSDDDKGLMILPKKISLREFFESKDKCSEDFLVSREQSTPQIRELF